MIKKSENIKPFVKWAGGKNQILDKIKTNYPKELGKTINRYCEPFVGGGAVFFDIVSYYNIKEILINDINEELINTYRIIKNEVTDLIKLLNLLQEEFVSLSNEKRKEYYYSKRDSFNKLKLNARENINIEKATLFIFLNKTCFNGLYRVNSRGLFNVPMGDYKNPIICDKNNLLTISNKLKKVTILSRDYSECLEFINKNTFVYLDPPYRPINATSSFTAYTENNFDDKEQIRLSYFVNKLNEIGAYIILSNSDPKNIDKNDNFFEQLYSKYTINKVNAKRMINCNGKCRGNISELIITNNYGVNAIWKKLKDIINLV